MTIYYKEKPYYDNTEENLSKGYNTIIGRPSTVEQAREFTELQSTLYSHIQRIADTVLKNGDRISGCNLIISDNNTKATITAGSIYLDGLVLTTDGGSLDITGVGQEVIGAKVKNTIVTPSDDASLYDPAEESDNAGQPGGFRNKSEVVFTIGDSNSTPLFTLNNGTPLVDNSDHQLAQVTDLLAKRTWDESGNYKIQGLLVSANPNVSSLDKIPLQLSSGRAYIKGYEVNKTVTSSFTVDTSTDYDTAHNELKRYVDGTLVYPLNNPSVRNINRVTMNVYSEKSVTRGPIPGGRDSLADSKSSVVSILEVSDSSRTYKYGDDYTLDDNNSTINWSNPTGNEPSTGSTYVIKMVVTQDLPKESYNLGSSSDGTKDSLVLNDKAPKPYVQDNTQFNGIFYIEYEFYYVRQDLILLDQSGNIIVLKGRPDLVSKVETPSNQNDNLLPISSVRIQPIDNTVQVINSDEVRLTMNDLYNLVKRVNDLEDNQAQQDLDRAAQDGEDATRLSGIYTDGFLNIKKADINHPDYKGSIDLDQNEFTVNSEQTVTSLKIDNGNVSTDVGIVGRVVSAPFTPVLSLSQPVSTESTPVNKFAVYNPLALVTLTPAVDNWVDESKSIVSNTKTTTSTLRRWWYHGGASWTDSEKQKWIDAGFADGGRSLGWSGGTGTTTSTTSTVDLDEAVFYMRQKEVTVSGTNFLPNSDNIQCTFNDIPVSLTPTGTTSAGTSAGTVKCDEDGKFSASFTVPANVQCGTVEVAFKNTSNYGSTSYTANGRKRHVTDSVLTVITNVSPQDPIAETFQFVERDSIVIKAGLFFASKDSAKSIIVELRDTVNGYPGTKVYARKILAPEDINLSDDGSAETLVSFDQPTLCDKTLQYSLAVVTDSNEYSVYTATRGNKITGTNTMMTTNPYSDGVMFVSSNNLAWESQQDSDLKFNLYAAQYNPAGGKIIFDDVTVDTVNRILLASDYIDKKNAGITWQYSIDSGKNWTDLDNFVDQDLSSTTDKISLLASIKVVNNSSPIIAGDTMNLVTFLDDKDFSYVSRNVGVSTPFTKLKITVISNYQIDPAITMNVYYSTDTDGKDWIELSKPTVSAYSSEFNKFVFETDGIQSKTNYRVKISEKTANILVRPRLKSVASIMKF